MPIRIGVDTGGTFVDVVVGGMDGQLRLSKSLADPTNLAGSVITALDAAARERGVSLVELLAQTDRIVHGTTVATNALLTNSGPPVALLTTEGFRDVINMRRGVRDRPMDSRRPPPKALIARSRIFAVRERLTADGAELVPLDPDDVARTVAALGNLEVEGVAICLMFSFLDPRHEAELRDAVHASGLDVHVSLSSEVMPQIGLYERASTTAVNAFVSPLLSRYLGALADALLAAGFKGSLLLMQSNGGVSSVETGKQFGVRSVLSGPAAAPIAAASVAGVYGLSNVISVDMGGTSFDVCLINDGEPRVTDDGELAGYRIALPMVAIHTIGAGGGSIVGVDSRGLLSVGPQSAGATPGPACYGRGGVEPTVTDANVLLGYVAPGLFWGGRLEIDTTAARRAMHDKVASPLEIDVLDAAYGAYQVVNENMVDAIREVSVRRGFDPREFVLVAAGGAGPLHVGALAEELAIPVVIIPKLASVFCALGGLLSDLRYEALASLVAPLDTLEIAKANDAIQTLRQRLEGLLDAEGVTAAATSIQVLVYMRYMGQFHELDVPLSTGEFSSSSCAELAAEFHRRHEVVNGYQEPSHKLEVMYLRVVANGKTDKPPMTAAVESRTSTDAPLPGERSIYWEGRSITVPVHDRAVIPPQTRITGPAIVTEETTTLVVPPGYELLTDEHGNGLMYVQGEDVMELIARLASPATTA